MENRVITPRIKLGKPVRYKINNTIVSSVSIPVTNSVWSSVRDSINISMRWRINL